MQTLLQHKLIVIIVALVIAGAVWYGLSSSSTEPNLTETPTTENGTPVDQGIVSTLLTLRTVKLDGMIFSNPAFLRLKDFSTEIVPEPVGRTNPFAPLSSQSPLSSSSTNSVGDAVPARR